MQNGKLDHVAHGWRKIGLFREKKSICDNSRLFGLRVYGGFWKKVSYMWSNQMP